MRYYLALVLILFLLLPLFSSIRFFQKKLFKLATGEEKPAKWRILSRARQKYGPYIRWKEDLIKRLITGSQIISTSKGTIEYTIHGNSGSYLTFMHGGPGGYDQAAAIFSNMFGQGFRVLCWSRPGYIRTPLDVGKTFEDQADALASLMDALHIKQTAVLGYSAGGPPAIHFAARHPNRIWALILESAVSQAYEVSPENIREKIFFSHLMFNDPSLWLSNLIARYDPRLIGRSTIKMESLLDEDKAQELIRDIMHDSYRVDLLMNLLKSMSPTEFRKKGLDNDMEQLSLIEKLPLEMIRTPTSVIHGTADADVPLEHAQKSAGSIPGSELYLVEGGFHILALSDDIDKINEKRVGFLKKHAPH